MARKSRTFGVIAFLAGSLTLAAQEPNKGKQAVMDRIKSFLDRVQSFDVIESFAKGPMVFNERHDHFTAGPLKMWHGVGVFFLFGFFTLVALAYFWRKVPETRGRSLQEIEHELTGSKA